MSLSSSLPRLLGSSKDRILKKPRNVPHDALKTIRLSKSEPPIVRMLIQVVQGIAAPNPGPNSGPKFLSDHIMRNPAAEGLFVALVAAIAL